MVALITQIRDLNKKVAGRHTRSREDAAPAADRGDGCSDRYAGVRSLRADGRRDSGSERSGSSFKKISTILLILFSLCMVRS